MRAVHMDGQVLVIALNMILLALGAVGNVRSAAPPVSPTRVHDSRVVRLRAAAAPSGAPQKSQAPEQVELALRDLGDVWLEVRGSLHGVEYATVEGYVVGLSRHATLLAVGNSLSFSEGGRRYHVAGIAGLYHDLVAIRSAGAIGRAPAELTEVTPQLAPRRSRR